jgi:SMI1-KNR4 cell-wall
MYLDQFKAELPKLRIHNPERVIPCTEAEVAALEQTLAYPLPAAYREFLLWMGNGGGGFMDGQECWYHNIAFNQREAVLIMNSIGYPLPEHAFVFFMHQGEQFSFFVLGEGDDPPIYDYHESMGTVPARLFDPHFSVFLTKLAHAEARIMATWSEATRRKWLELE